LNSNWPDFKELATMLCHYLGTLT